MSLSVGLPEGLELNGVVVTGPARRVGDSLVYPAVVGQDRVQLREYWPADLFYRTAAKGGVAAQQAFEAPLAHGRARFTDLTRRLEAFAHPFVPRSTGFEANGCAYRVTETARKPLGQVLSAAETLPASVVHRLAAGLADALEAAHQHGLLHLDVQPQTVAVADIGIELTGFCTDRRPLMKPAGRQDGLVSPGYSPIELHDAALQDPLGPSTDIHAASALLRRLIVGRAFLDGEQALRLADAPLDWPSGHGVAPEIIAAIEAGLKVHPEDRPLTVAAWRRDWPSRPPVDDAWRALASRGSGVALVPPEPAAPPHPSGIAPLPSTPQTPASAPPMAPTPATPAAPGLKPDDLAPLPPLPSMAPKKKGNDFLRVLLVIGALLAAGLVFMNYAVKPAVEAERSQTWYVTRGVRVRPAPSTANRPLTELRRGEQVRGHPVAGEDGASQWLKVTAGPHRGQYVWLRNLSTTARPALASSRSEKLFALEAVQLRAEPRDGAAAAGALKTGDAVQVQGTTADGWSELALSQGGVGYVRSSALGELRQKDRSFFDNLFGLDDEEPALDPAEEETGPVSGDPAEADDAFFDQYQRDDGRRGNNGRGKGRGPPR
jgi:hypothetical protein